MNPVLLTCCLAFASQPEPPEIADDRQPETLSSDFSGLIPVVEVELPSYGKLTMAIDTGATCSYVTPASAVRLGLPVTQIPERKREQFPESMHQAVWPRVRMETSAGLEINTDSFFVYDLLAGADLTFPNGAPDGVLGWHALRQLAIHFDYRNQRIQVCEPHEVNLDSNWTSLVSDFSGHKILVEGMLTSSHWSEPHSAPFIFDTGSHYGITLSANVAKHYAIDLDRHQELKPFTTLGSTMWTVGEADLNCGDTPFGPVSLSFMDKSVTLDDGFGILGNEIIRKHEWWIVPQKNIVAVKLHREAEDEDGGNPTERTPGP